MDASLRQQTRSISPHSWHKAGSVSLKPSEPAGKDMNFSFNQDVCEKKNMTQQERGERKKGKIKISARAHTHTLAGETASHVLHIRPEIL